MLSALLPGLRNVRSPLSAGVLILAGLYVLAGGWAETRFYDEFGGGFRSLEHELGRTEWTVVLAVAAYLLGALYLRIIEAVLRNLSNRLVAWMVLDGYLTRRQKVWESILAPFSRPSLGRLGRHGLAERDPEQARRVCRDIIYGGGKRLLIAHNEAWQEWDRLRSEAEFRDAIAVPLVFLALAITVDSHMPAPRAAALVALALAAGAALFAAARREQREASSMHAHLVADGVVSTATLDSPGTSRDPSRLGSVEE